MHACTRGTHLSTCPAVVASEDDSELSTTALAHGHALVGNHDGSLGTKQAAGLVQLKLWEGGREGGREGERERGWGGGGGGERERGDELSYNGSVSKDRILSTNFRKQEFVIVRVKVQKWTCWHLHVYLSSVSFSSSCHR